jgi:mediator of RNA polymerase II transcription subunit 18
LCLTKQHIFKNIQEYSTIESRSAAEFSPAQQLPAWESLTPMDKQNRWILQVKTHVLQDNKPDEIRKAQEQLHSIRNELDGVFAFKVIDRKVHDTRVALPQQGVQALPQKVTIGK